MIADSVSPVLVFDLIFRFLSHSSRFGSGRSTPCEHRSKQLSDTRFSNPERSLIVANGISLSYLIDDRSIDCHFVSSLRRLLSLLMVCPLCIKQLLPNRRRTRIPTSESFLGRRRDKVARRPFAAAPHSSRCRVSHPTHPPLAQQPKINGLFSRWRASVISKMD